MKMINRVLFLLLSVSALASAYAQNGIYTTLTTGVGLQSGLPSASAVNATNTSRKSFLSAIRAGIGYNHDLFACLGLGLDMGIGWYGQEMYQFPETNKHIYSRTLEFLAFLQYHVNNKWDVMPKLGGLRQTMMITGGDSSENQTQIHPEVALAVFYNFTCVWALQAEYIHVFGQTIKNFDELQNKTPSIDSLMFGVRYQF